MNKTDKNEIVNIVKSEIKNFVRDSFDSELKKIMSKKNSQTRDEMVTLMKNSLESVYKMLWQKRDFWKNDIK